MKQKIFTFLLIAATGLTACKKNNVDPDIKQYDETQIQNYISANSFTGFSRDTTDGDTTGMYYKIMNAGTGAPLEYSDQVSLVYTLKSFDGRYISSDTITNHFQDFLGYLLRVRPNSQFVLPKGLQTAIHNNLKYKDGSMRVLIPSRLAYGLGGYTVGGGSVTNANSRIAGNQSIDMYVHVINDQQVYDDQVIRNYMAANSLSGYTKTATGVYYKILKDKTAGSFIRDTTNFTTTYTAAFLNNVVFENSGTTAVSFTSGSLVPGVKEVIEGFAGLNTSISILLPSKLGYGIAGSVSQTTGVQVIPANTPLKFEFQIATVTN